VVGHSDKGPRKSTFTTPIITCPYNALLFLVTVGHRQSFSIGGFADYPSTWLMNTSTASGVCGTLLYWRERDQGYADDDEDRYTH